MSLFHILLLSTLLNISYKFIIAYKIGNQLDPLDLTTCQNLELVFTNDSVSYEFPLYVDSLNNPKLGVCAFKIPQSSYIDIKNLYTSNINVFYITTTNQQITTTIYAGLFVPADSMITNPIPISGVSSVVPSIISDPSATTQQVAIVTRQLVNVGSATTSNPLSAFTLSSALINVAPLPPIDKYSISNLNLGTFSNSG